MIPDDDRKLSSPKKTLFKKSKKKKDKQKTINLQEIHTDVLLLIEDGKVSVDVVNSCNHNSKHNHNNQKDSSNSSSGGGSSNDNNNNEEEDGREDVLRLPNASVGKVRKFCASFVLQIR